MRTTDGAQGKTRQAMGGRSCTVYRPRIAGSSGTGKSGLPATVVAQIRMEGGTTAAEVTAWWCIRLCEPVACPGS